MDPAVWTELIKALPWGFVIIALRYLDIKEKAEERKERDFNAKEKSIADRETQIIINKTYADAINNLASTLNDFKGTVVDHYENMGITQNLLKTAKDELKTYRNKDKG